MLCLTPGTPPGRLEFQSCWSRFVNFSLPPPPAKLTDNYRLRKSSQISSEAIDRGSTFMFLRRQGVPPSLNLFEVHSFEVYGLSVYAYGLSRKNRLYVSEFASARGN